MTTNLSLDLDPQLLDAFTKSAEISAPPGLSQPGIAAARRDAELVRAYWNEGGPKMAQVLERSIPGPLRHVPVVVYYPNSVIEPLPVFVYLHGGGFKIGSPWANDRQLREIASVWRGIVVSADYAHVPEYAFPTPVEETVAVLKWLHKYGNALGIDGDRIAFGGTSAGANVAFGAAIALGGVSWLRAGVSAVGAFSSDTSSRSMRLYGDAGLFPDIATARAIFDDYLLNHADRNDPRVNLLIANPDLLPPCFLAAAEFDVFRDSSAAMADRLGSVERLHELKVYPKMAHLFFGMSRSVDRAAECASDIGHFLAERLPV
jgi:acetyl esterase